MSQYSMIVKKRLCHFIHTVFPFCLLLIPVMSAVSSCKQPAKTEPDIAGAYDTSSGDPEGKGVLCVLPNHSFVLGFFGGAVTGIWQIKDSSVIFKPHVKPTGFRVYGRHNNRLRDSIRILFEGFADHGTIAIGFDPLTKKARLVFDKGPHRTDFPYVGKFAGVPAGILLTGRSVNEVGQILPNAAWRIYTYINPNKYNDFVAEFTPENTRPKSNNFYGTINKAGKLEFDQKASEKKPFGKNDKKFIDQMLSISVDPDQVFYDQYYTPAEPGFERDTLHYRFNAQKSAYVNFHRYVDIEENKPQKEDGSNSLIIIYKYQKLSGSITSGRVNLDTRPYISSQTWR
jgi:hypothetical protein